MTKYTKIKRDILTSCLFLIFAVTTYLILIPDFVAQNSEGVLSPQFFPYLSAFVLGIASVSVLGISIYRFYAIYKLSPPKKHHVSVFFPLKTFVFVIALIGLVWAFEYVGYILSLPVFTAIFIILFGDKISVMILGKSCIITGIVFLIFHYGLRVYLL